MIKTNINIGIQTGLDARPTAMLVQLASQYESAIHVISKESKYNAKSIMGMMTLGLKAGEEITVIADGTDEEAAIENIEKYLMQGK
ncbi:HPr family phosphocarrier protein [[Clostridium] fimetarium]|uniref:Catabolite repression HPr-like protein n=1 Tax=[Clostridium] fimetarium TaxID=99656 RepID=A0A1I0M7P7_9FIRM|nr:HPr family phosphocarrier protein [[Clostridium] fimetarium]SEV84332.1 catabolite repression HPr-like protein [[Clostridium] fimetarium]